MTFVPFDDTVRASIRMTCEGKNLVNTLWFRHLGGFTEVEGAELADQLDLWAAGFLNAQLVTAVTYQETTVYDMRSADSWVVINDDNTGATGDIVGSTLPLNAAMTVTFNTARRGRSYRGRNYISGLAEASASGTVFSGSAPTNMEQAYEELLGSDFTGIGWVWVVASRVQNGVELAAGVTTPVTGVRANTRIYKMGRRTA